jgi:four helix bundle protein
MIQHEKIEAWRLGHHLALDVYSATERWPRAERYELTSQVRRAALSIPANIAEGTARYGAQELRRFLNIALGSLAELSYLLYFARDRGFLNPAQWEALESLRDRTGKATWGLLQSLVEGRSRTRRDRVPKPDRRPT